MKEKTIKVLITAIGGNSVGYQLLKSLKIAPKTKYLIYGADTKSHAYQYSLVEDFIVLPSCNSPEYIDELLNFCKRHEIDVLLPGCEPELKVLASNREKIEKLNIFMPITTNQVLDICTNKLLTNEFLQKNGFKYPKTAIINNNSNLDEIDFYPLVIKPAVGGSGSQGIKIAQNKIQLKALLAYSEQIAENQEYMLQEYVGTAENEYTCGLLFTMQGKYVNTIILKRDLSTLLSQTLVEKNITTKQHLGDNLVISSGVSQGEFICNDLINQFCQELGEKIKAVSAINIQCRLVDNEVYVFEINPRFSGTSYMRAMQGFNEADILIRAHFFQEAPKQNFEYKLGTITRALEERQINEI